MAQYKVPQDVEAEDKLLGPFTFRQFIYLVVGAILLAVAWGLFQLLPFLAILPLPLAIFFIVLALPLRKDQPMEVYLAAVLSFYLRPNKRVWTSGQRESTIKITAPKTVEKPRTRNISEEEAGHRLRFLSELVDTEGMSIRNNGSSMRDEYVAEANQVEDILDDSSNFSLNQMIENEQNTRHDQLVNQMRAAISRTESLTTSQAPQTPPAYTPQPIQQAANYSIPNAADPTVAAQMQNLANNNSFSVATLSQQANRVQGTQSAIAAQQAAAFQQFEQSQQNRYQAYQPQPQAYTQPVAQPAPQPAPQPMPQPTMQTMPTGSNPNGLRMPVFTPDPNNLARKAHDTLQYQAFDSRTMDELANYKNQQAAAPKSNTPLPPMLNEFEAKVDNGRNAILDKFKNEGPEISFHN